VSGGEIELSVGGVMDDLVPVRLVPVEVFGGDCSCHEEAGHAYIQPEGTPEGMTAQEQPSGVIKLVPRCEGWSYGLSDAVGAKSDCNRAIGKIYRVHDTDHASGRPEDTVVVFVPRSAVQWFETQRGEAYGTPYA